MRRDHCIPRPPSKTPGSQKKQSGENCDIKTADGDDMGCTHRPESILHRFWYLALYS